MTKKPIRIFLVADFKYNDKGPQYGFKRMHLRTLYTSLRRAKYYGPKWFCDEAGWYDGCLIEEKEEGDPGFFKGRRFWYIQEKGGQMREIPEPKDYKNVRNMI